MNYLFFEDNVYPLYTGNTYQLGPSIASNIYLPILENVVLEVKETGVELLGETYSYGYHLVSIAEDISVSLLIIKNTEYYLLPEKILYLSDKKEATIRLVDFPIEIILSFDGTNKQGVLHPGDKATATCLKDLQTNDHDRPWPDLQTLELHLSEQLPSKECSHLGDF